MKRAFTRCILLTLLFLTSHIVFSQNQITYGFVQDDIDQLKLTAVAYPNFTSSNVTISTALFTFYLPEGTETDPDIPVLPAFGSFTDITGTWRIEKITPDLYDSFGFDPADLQGNDVYQCILQNSPSPNATSGQPISLFSFRLPGDCMGGTVQVHTNDNAIQMALLNNVGLNINNQISVSVNDDPAEDIYFGNDPATDEYDCPLDDVPVAVDDLSSTDEDMSVSIDVTDNDNFGSDGPNDMAIVIITNPANGTAIVDDQGTPDDPTDDQITYTPNANFNGPDTITYQICDADNDCDTATVSISINAVNDAPIANDDNTTTNEDTPVVLMVTANDTDVDGNIDPTTVDLDTGTPGIQTSVTVPGGTFVSDGAGNVTFTPNPDFNGTEMIDYQVCDDGTPLPPLCDIATITVDVSPVNDPPMVPDTTVTTPEDTPFDVCVPITDIDNTTFSVSSICTPDGGVVSGLTDPATTEYCLTYTPNPDYNGPDTLCIEVCDGSGACDTSYVIITVTPVNDPPMVPDTTVTTPEDTPFDVCVPISDVDNTTFSVSSICTPEGGMVSGLTDPATTEYCLTYTPNPDYNGPDTLCIEVCDGSGACDTSYVIITVTPVNDPPVANDDSATTDEDMPVVLMVTANDTDVDGNIDPATVDLDTGTPGIQTTYVAPGGTFTSDGLGNVTFTPNANFNGMESIDYQVCDDGTPLPPLCDQASITVTVMAVNDPPVANDDSATTDEDMPVVLVVTANDTDVDGNIDPATVDLDTGTPGVQSTFVAPGGTFTSDGLGNVTFTPNANFNGMESIDYQVCDDGTPLPPLCDQATINITVNSVNDPPLAVDDIATTPEDTPVEIPVLDNDSDIDGTLDPSSVTIVSTPDHGTTSINPLTGDITYTPDTDFVGNDTLTYVVCDSGTPILCDTAAVFIEVTATSVRLIAEVMLQGALFNNPDTLTRMRDDLRTAGRIPLLEPYTALPAFIHVGGGNEMITDSSTVLADHGGNSIVDWVFVELRDPSDSSDVVATRSALLQRDGDIVDVDGVSPLVFENTLPANYFVSVRHRNHLGIMTNNSIAMTNGGTLIDFTDLGTELWDDGTNLDGFEQVTVNGMYALWAGNVNTNNSVVFAGQNNDKDPIFNEIDQAPNNIFHSQSYVYFGYHLGDVNMDGKAIFAGQNNDVDFIFNNVDGHPKNITHSQSYVIRQQLPQ